MFYHSSTERLLTVGHPLYEIKSRDGRITVPKVSPSQYRVFRFTLPDPNKFTFPSADIYNPETERLVWAVRGLEVGRGQPLGIPVTGHPFFNKYRDVENVNSLQNVPDKDNRVNTAIDPKQMQLIILGNTPTIGEHWDIAKACATEEAQDELCPPIELVNTLIEDGVMADIGFGNINTYTMQENKSDTPLDLVGEIVKYPDVLKMSEEPYGNSMFFMAKREQVYGRHLWTHAGVTGEDVPADLFISGNGDGRMGPVAYFSSPSGSLSSSEQQIFNRAYWLQRAQGINNGVAWNNELFLTCVDNTRGTPFTLSQVKKENKPMNVYDASQFRTFTRHVEEYEVKFVFQLCIVSLTPEVLSHLHAMDPRVLDGWNLGIIQPGSTLEDKYRYINSFATRCPDQNPPEEPEDPYKDYHFWSVDLTKTFSSDLENYSLGRKFLAQSGLRNGVQKRQRPKAVSFANSAPKAVKKRRRA